MAQLELVRSVTVMRQHTKMIVRFVFRLSFGLLALITGWALISWVCYNEFIHRLPGYTGAHWWEPFGIAPAMIGTGIYWLRTLRTPPEIEPRKT